ncbi:MAG: type II toxin-antitoxin system RelE/ParE family toxin [Ruminococcus sp.]|nr:type II toxin-antitoxin system RelE/ParE family toxin [Ruminococcus sp.]
MKIYKVTVTPDAQDALKKYLRYLKSVKKSPQAAKSVMNDFIETRKELSACAGSLASPDNQKLRERSLKRMYFLHHSYFMLYRIDGDTAVIVSIFHSLEDIDNKLK